MDSAFFLFLLCCAAFWELKVVLESSQGGKDWM